jgi:CHAT domain-containing protein
LWQVDDTSTRDLMDRFYRHLWNGGADVTPAKALRAAQLDLYRGLRATSDRHPRLPVVSAKPAPPPPPGGGPVRDFDADTYSWGAFVASGAP